MLHGFTNCYLWVAGNTNTDHTTLITRNDKKYYDPFSGKYGRLSLTGKKKIAGIGRLFKYIFRNL